MYNFHMGINQRWGYISFYLAYNGDIIYDIYYIYTCIRLWWLWKRQYEVGEFAWGLNQYDPGPDHCRKLPSSAGISGLLPGCRSQFLLAISEDIWTLSSFFFARNIHLFWLLESTVAFSFWNFSIALDGFTSHFGWFEIHKKWGNPLLVWNRQVDVPAVGSDKKLPASFQGSLMALAVENDVFFLQKLKFLDVFR